MKRGRGSFSFLAASIVLALAAGAGEAVSGATARPAAPTLSRGPIAAEPDSGMSEFLKSLSDSTDDYFGRAAAPLDTTGLDSALAYALENPDLEPRPRAIRFGAMPSFTFNRVDGPTYGGEVRMGNPRRWGELFGEAAYAVGPNDWIGGGGYRGVLRRGRAAWNYRFFGGSNTISMGREQSERHLTSFRALLAGSDHRSYLRQKGIEARFFRETEIWRAGLAYRNMRDAPLFTTTTWNLIHRNISVVENLAATPGRTAEVELFTTWRTPILPLTVELVHHQGAEALGGDFDYRRTRGSLAGAFGVGQIATLVPQFLYGRLHGDALPQTSFYLGGSRSLRSLPGSSRGGTGIAVARLDLLGSTDILSWARIPHPEMFPIQAGLFGAAGAVWGKDPYGGPAARGGDWPGRENWATEIGVSLMYQPGVPDPTAFIRMNHAWALGPGRETNRWTISFTRAPDLVRPLGN